MGRLRRRCGMCASVLSVGLLASGIDAQETLRETTVAAAASEPAAESEYEPCSTRVTSYAAWCRGLRERVVEKMASARFEGDGRECRLFHPDEEYPERFVCGELLVALRSRVQWTDLKAIREAADGEWVRLAGAGSWVLSGRLHVSPGTERSAIRNIIYHPMVVWVELNHIGGVVGGARPAEGGYAAVAGRVPLRAGATITPRFGLVVSSGGGWCSFAGAGFRGVRGRWWRTVRRRS